MNGLIQEDSELASAMDKSGEGKYTPKLLYNKNGALNAYCTSYIKPENFSLIFDHIERIMSKTGDIIASGDSMVIKVNIMSNYVYDAELNYQEINVDKAALKVNFLQA